jgi:HSP20 family protein
MELTINNRSVIDDVLNDGFFGNLFNTSRHYCPSVDINETKDLFEVIVEVPGVPKEDLKVSIHQNVLSVSGKRSAPSYEGKRRIVSEISSGDFSRKFRLPSSVNVDAVTTEYTSGLLRITLPKQEESKAKEIPIQ